MHTNDKIETSLEPFQFSFKNLFSFFYSSFRLLLLMVKMFVPVLYSMQLRLMKENGKWKKGDAKRNFAYSMFGWLYGLLLLIVDELVRVKMFFVVVVFSSPKNSVQMGFEAYRHLGPKT